MDYPYSSYDDNLDGLVLIHRDGHTLWYYHNENITGKVYSFLKEQGLRPQKIRKLPDNLRVLFKLMFA